MGAINVLLRWTLKEEEEVQAKNIYKESLTQARQKKYENMSFWDASVSVPRKICRKTFEDGTSSSSTCHYVNKKNN